MICPGLTLSGGRHVLDGGLEAPLASEGQQRGTRPSLKQAGGKDAALVLSNANGEALLCRF